MMKKIFWILRLAVTGLAMHLPAMAMQESNTVPSSQLMADFSVAKTAGEDLVVVIPFLFKAPERAGEAPTLLSISANETLTFSVESASVVCSQSKECILPFIKDGTYKVEVKRFNGELLRSQVVLPAETNITAPAANTTFSKFEGVRFSWTPSRAYMKGISLSVFLAGLNCDTMGSLDWDAEFSALAPSGYVGKCNGPVKARFTVFYKNTSPIPGLGGGALKAFSMANLPFTFVDSNTVVISSDSAADRLSFAELRELLLQLRSQPQAGETILKF